MEYILYGISEDFEDLQVFQFSSFSSFSSFIASKSLTISTGKTDPKQKTKKKNDIVKYLGVLENVAAWDIPTKTALKY